LYQAQAMIKQGNNEQAREVLGKAVNAMPSSSDLAPLFNIKMALMNLDSNAPQAVAQLKELATNTSSHFSDAAAYYLGQYYWINNDEKQAKEVWHKMINATQTDKKLGQSPWAQLAQEKMAQ
jgi:predicted negative regulator of RcsB-dependent stress response